MMLGLFGTIFNVPRGGLEEATGRSQEVLSCDPILAHSSSTTPNDYSPLTLKPCHPAVESVRR